MGVQVNVGRRGQVSKSDSVGERDRCVRKSEEFLRCMTGWQTSDAQEEQSRNFLHR